MNLTKNGCISDESFAHRVAEILDRLPARTPPGFVDLLHALTSFNTHETLVARQKQRRVVDLLQRATATLVRDALE